MGDADAERRVQEVMDRWDRRLAEATVAWNRLPAGERRRWDTELDERGETDEWVLVLFAWWQRSTLAAREELADDVQFLASVLRGAAASGHLSGAGDEAESGRRLLDALERMERILHRPGDRGSG